MSTQNTAINRTILNNGLVVVSEHIPTARSVYFSVWIKAGSRDESPANNGIAHFLEHMFFKGTKDRTAYEIASVLEDLGGNLNAYTGKESTVFYANTLSEDLTKTVDVISDMLCNSLFSENDIQHEQQVVLEEINSIKDAPEEYIFDLFQEELFLNQSLGLPILGTSKTVTQLNNSKLVDFYKSHYLSNNIVISAAGNLNHNDLVKMAEDKFCFIKREINDNSDCPVAPKRIKKKYSLSANQTHICAGLETVSYTSKKKYDLIAINTYLGGGMSSRLFQTIREKYGYAYTVYSSIDYYKDTGAITFYLGTNKKNKEKSFEILKEEISKMSQKELSPDIMSKIKMQMKGSFLLGQEDYYNRMSRLAKNEVYFGKQVNIENILKAIDLITPETIQNTAIKYLNVDEFNIIQIS